MSESFAVRLLAWFDVHGRRNLPWQQPREPYRVWLSEIMLQQTQVATVVPYFAHFVARFPSVEALAAAPIDEVLQLWAGLGYYARARNLHRTAQLLMERHGGQWPRELEALIALPGIGRSTAAAILAQAFGQRHAILDGNVKRVLARHGGVDGWTGLPAVQQKLWALSQSRLPETRLADYTQAIMDLGASVCLARRPLCAACPVAPDCVARGEQRVHELPAPRPRRARARRRAHLLLIENADRALLFERRAPSGIWGGLWCPPVIDESLDWREVLARRYALQALNIAPLPSLHHGFTHYDLELLPLRLRCTALDAVAETAPTAWIRIPDRDSWPGMPAPVRKLLDTALSASPAPPQQTLPWPEPSTA